MKSKKKTNDPLKGVEAIQHTDAKRKNIPTAEYESVVQEEDRNPIRVAYERRNRDLDPQLVWRGKDEQDWSDLIVQAPPLYIQEKVHPKVLIDDLLRQSRRNKKEEQGRQTDLFADFNGIPEGADKTEFYQHDQNWTNRMILGDSLHVMASLAEREGLRGKVQCIYFDPPYGIKFNSNFQWSTTSRKVEDGKLEHITREPEQVKAFRDTWRDGIHTYLTYLRDRMVVARDLLSDTGAIFVQINSENCHLVASLLDEVFGKDNFIANIVFRKKSLPLGSAYLETMHDHILFYAKKKGSLIYHQLYTSNDVSSISEHGPYALFPDGRSEKIEIEDFKSKVHPKGTEYYRLFSLIAPSYSEKADFVYNHEGKAYPPPSRGSWVVGEKRKLDILSSVGRLQPEGKSLSYRLFFSDFPYKKITNIWADISNANKKQYVVQTAESVIQRCILMASNPGDLILDPTCGSGTTSIVAEQWGRRWITIDTSRVALALARARIMGTRFPFYILSDSKEGLVKEAEIKNTLPRSQSVSNNIRYGFVNERVPHISLKSIVNNSELDVIWEEWQSKIEPFRVRLSKTIGRNLEEWEIPRKVDPDWDDETKQIHSEWWNLRSSRQKALNNSISSKAEFEYIYDKPFEDKKKVRVSGPFTVESMSPHRMLAVDENDNVIDLVKESNEAYQDRQSFPLRIMENLKAAGVQQAHKEDKISFISLVPWPGELVCGEAKYMEGNTEKRAAIFIGPEFGTVQRADLVAAAREAGDAGFDVLISCAFNYEAHTTEFAKLGRIPVLKARMNADLHMADDLKNTGKGNLFVVFGEPDIEILPVANSQYQIKVNGVDVFHPSTGKVESSGAEGIACWFIDTDYNEESFFVRHAYFLGANDPYGALKTTLKAEIDPEAWETLHSDISRPFDKPPSGRIAVKVINHLGDEVMKIFKV